LKALDEPAPASYSRWNGRLLAQHLGNVSKDQVWRVMRKHDLHLDKVRRQEIPIIGRGEGVWSFVHVEDAALATIAAMSAPPGIYNVVDDDPSPVSRWLPEFAYWVGAPPPLHLTEPEACEAAGERVGL
jgi:nucleoside-diphosphate-sugar epimerase